MLIQNRIKPASARAGVFSLNDNNPLVPYLYLLPHAIFFLAFIVYPVGYGVYISVHRWDPLNPVQPYVGLDFYRNVFTPGSPQNDFFWLTFKNTLVFTVISTPLLVGAALGLATLLFRPVFARGVFRAIFFMPGILSVSVMGLLWRWLFDNQAGLLNVIQQSLGGQPVPYLTTEGLAWIPIIVGTVWWTVGFNMTLYLAAMSGISRSYYEAAELDGASGWAQFRFITFPLLAPTSLFVSVTTVLAGLQLFGQSAVITGGGPTRSTQSVIQYITEEGLSNGQYSSGAALSFVFGLMMLVFTAIQFRIMTADVSPRRREA